jgi:hypothetical protein
MGQVAAFDITMTSDQYLSIAVYISPPVVRRWLLKGVTGRENCTSKWKEKERGKKEKEKRGKREV